MQTKDSWKPLGRIATGGTALSISGDSRRRVFIASPAGLFRGDGETFSLVARGFPFLQTSATLVVNDIVYVAGLPEGLMRSHDGGDTWDRCWAEQIRSPIVCFAASPRFNHDGVVFAGTQSDGVLRSIDGGKHWSLSNFGLRNFSALAIAVAPQWGRREFMFIGTENGVYRSPNGGRAWKAAGLEGQVVQAIAVSPNFAEDKTVFAGTESKGLFRSGDGGESWSRVKSFAAESVNALCYFKKYLLAATDGDTILRSSDDGESWSRSNKTSSALCIARVGDKLYAGVEDGVLRSDDGKKWSSVEIAAHRFDWLIVPAEDLFVAGGVTSGVWVSQDGARWNQTAKLESAALLFNIAATHEVLLAATPNHLLRSIDLGKTWDGVLEKSITAMAFSDDKTVWAGGDDGALMMSGDRGRSWQMMPTPFESLAVVGVAATAPETVIVAVADRAARRVLFYRSTNSGEHWKLILDQSSTWFTPRLSDEVIGLGTTLMQMKSDGWSNVEVTDDDAPINSVLSLDDMDLVGTAAGVLSVGRNKAKDFSQGMEGVPIVSLQKLGRKLFALSADGMVWERKK